MYWEEDKKSEKTFVTDDVVDLVFGIECKYLPVDHAYALSDAVQEILPWLSAELTAGVHPIHVAASGNGWIRPDEPDALLHLSHRTRLELRIPGHRVADARELEGKTLEVSGSTLVVKQATARPMSTITTLLCRHLAADKNINDENVLLEWVAQRLEALEIVPRKMMCGVAHVIQHPDGPIHVRSIMLADLEIEESLAVQKIGLGPHRTIGCGLFIPQRHINDLRDEKD